MIKVKARAVNGLNKPFEVVNIDRRDLEPSDVLIDIKYCGICHSDIHHVKGEWKKETYPLVPGHEITGIVAEVGKDVTKHKAGDRVGVGCMVDSCRECDNCKNGNEQYCLKGNTLTYGAVDKYGEFTQGGYSTKIVVDEDFVLRIPDGLELDSAAPLLCAGITTYSPLLHWHAGPGKKIAVIGLGGLGHMAVKLAHALGAEVSVLSQTLSKQEDGLAFGADKYYATSNEETFKELKNSFDLIINTVSAGINVDDYLSLLSLDGSIVNVGASPDPLSLNVFSLLGLRRSFAGSLIGGIKETQQMLDFCADNNIKAEIELINANDIDSAYKRVESSDVRYRFVIDTSTI